MTKNFKPIICDTFATGFATKSLALRIELRPRSHLYFISRTRTSIPFSPFKSSTSLAMSEFPK